MLISPEDSQKLSDFNTENLVVVGINVQFKHKTGIRFSLEQNGLSLVVRQLRYKTDEEFSKYVITKLKNQKVVLAIKTNKKLILKNVVLNKELSTKCLSNLEN